MKIISFSSQGEQQLGIVEDDLVYPSGMRVELASLLRRDNGLADLYRMGRKKKPLPLGKVKILAPVTNPQKFICVALNYMDHCLENHIPPPKSPVIFAKYASAIIGHNDPIVHPRITKMLDYEVELAVIIGKKGKKISEAKAYDYVAGYTICNDVSARDVQMGDGQYTRGKTSDTFAPLGPWLVTHDEIGDPQDLHLRCLLNDKVLQDSNTRKMIFKIPYLLSFVSQAITLLPGDVLATGTPHGVGYCRKPRLFMKPGDVVQLEVEKIGKLVNRVVAER